MRVLCVLLLAGLGGCFSGPVLITDRVIGFHERRVYLDYRNRTAQLNLEREKAGLAPEPLLSFAEWQALR